MVLNSLDLRLYEKRVALARATQLNIGTLERSSERLPVLSRHFNKTDECIDFGIVHKYGLLHVTADILILDTENRVLLQVRRDPANSGHGQLTASAGGHCQLGETPLETALRELSEELGVTLSSSHKIHCLSIGNGWANYVFSVLYTSTDQMLSLVWDNPLAERPRQMRKTEDVPVTAVSRMQFGLPWDPVTEVGGMRLSTWQFNQELCHYFAVQLQHSDFRNLKPNPSEVLEIRRYTIDELSETCESSYATDSLWCFGRNRGAQKMKSWMAQ